MSSGWSFFLGLTSSSVVVLFVVAGFAVRRHRLERQFAEALALLDDDDEVRESKDLLSMASAMSYSLLLRQAVLERCEGIEDEDERLSFVDDLVDIAEAYGDGLVKRSKNLRY